MAQERCGECGFDGSSWRVADAGSLLGGLGWWWRHATAGIEAATLASRPAPATWSAVEYALHTALVTAMHREGLTRMVAEDGVVLPHVPAMAGAAPADVPVDIDAGVVVADLEREGRALADLARNAPEAAWSHGARLGDETLVAGPMLLHAAHDASHHMFDVARGLTALGASPRRHQGTVLQVNTSDGGVPKHAVASTVVDHGGVAGDRQADRRHHGRPFQALCVWSAEVIEELAAAGHPIQPGSAGENITIAGVDWAAMRPGTLLRIGSALAEVSFAATPCAKQKRWFTDGDFGRIDHDRNPQWTRWYAWVREPGDVRPGDPVAVQPPL